MFSYPATPSLVNGLLVGARIWEKPPKRFWERYLPGILGGELLTNLGLSFRLGGDDVMGFPMRMPGSEG